MSYLNNFIENILPGNYALTKSMEIGKTRSSGTLWYTKKFLVWYYFIFLSKEIETRDYVNKVKEIFNSYINSLDDSIKSKAHSYFFSDSEIINCNSENFKTFATFCGNKEFESPTEKNDYIESAKKYYFAFIMQGGGQSGVNKHIKDKHLYTKGFSYDNIEKIILEFYGKTDINLTQEINDYHAFLRNERQILYYYGFVHSKSTGANDKEFSSLTPIGELAMIANSNEFQCIWEHQKLKMISQPVTVNIGNIDGITANTSNFSINFSPYLDIINFLKVHKAMTYDEYQFIVSRNKETFRLDFTNVENINILRVGMEEIKRNVRSFRRSRDIKNEDSSKELKKYMLGIRDDLSLDQNTNSLAFCNFKNSCFSVTNIDRISFISDIYNRLNSYKIQKYEDLFSKCNRELATSYKHYTQGQDYSINAKIKIDWELFNMYPDKFILLGTMHTLVCCIHPNLEPNEAVSSLLDLFPNLCKHLGIKSITKMKNEYKQFRDALDTGALHNYINRDDDDYNSNVVATHTSESSSDLLNKIKNMSNNSSALFFEDRSRNSSLVSLLKRYYIQNFLVDDKYLRCECCGEVTFLTTSNEPYIEFHHLIPFGGEHFGPDHFLNLFAICPNCHRKIHFIQLNEKANLYQSINDNNYLKISFADRLLDLRSNNLLKSYHLEFLLADNAISQETYNIIAA